MPHSGPVSNPLITVPLLMGAVAVVGVAVLLSKVGVPLLQKVVSSLALERTRQRHFVEKPFLFCASLDW